MMARASATAARGAPGLALAALLVAACAPAMPDRNAAAPTDPVLLGTFTGEVDPVAGTFTIRPGDAGMGAGRNAIEEVTGVALSNASTPVRGFACTGGGASLSAAVRIVARPYFPTILYRNVYAQIETLSPPTGSQGCNSFAHPGGFANTGLGLWNYPSIGNPMGAVATWAFASPTSTPTTFTGKVYGTPVPVSGIKVAFITSANDYDGAEGGLSGADGKCQALADAAITAGSIPSGTYKAFLSTRSTNPPVSAKDRVPDAAFVRPDGGVIATSRSNLLTSGPEVPISVTEMGATWAKSASFTYAYVWTGSRPTGDLDQTSTTSTCTDWSSNVKSDRGTVGCVFPYPTQCGNDTATWTDQGGGNQADCSSTPGALYCFQQ